MNLEKEMLTLLPYLLVVCCSSPNMTWGFFHCRLKPTALCLNVMEVVAENITASKCKLFGSVLSVYACNFTGSKLNF